MSDQDTYIKELNDRPSYYENIPVTIFKDATSASVSIANEIADLIKKRNQENKPAVLGLATGSTPLKVYDELIRLHKEEGLIFRNVNTEQKNIGRGAHV